MWRYNGARESDENNFVSHRALFFFNLKEKKSKRIVFFFFWSRFVFLTHHFWSVGCLFLPSFFSPLKQRETTSFVPHDRTQHEF